MSLRTAPNICRFDGVNFSELREERQRQPATSSGIFGAIASVLSPIIVDEDAEVPEAFHTEAG